MKFASLIIYILLYIFIYIAVSRLNKSWLNAYTYTTANEIIIKTVPFLLSINRYSKEYNEAIWLFIIILFESVICKYIGYYLGYRKVHLHIPVKQQYYATYKYKFMLKVSLIIGVISFIILGYRGIGIKTWLLNPRFAYIHGRRGNGLFYVLLQLSIIASAVLILSIAKYYKNKPYGYIGIIFFAYFTGSKMIILGLILLYVYYKDLFIKKINLRELSKVGVIGLLGVIILLRMQSNTTFLRYSDYYSNFLKLLKYSLDSKWDFFNGNLTREHFMWSYIPRTFFPQKPYIYGSLRVTAIFYGERIILEGNTPSFSQFVLPYADYGILGVGVAFFLKGLFAGKVEAQLRNGMKKYGISFNYFIIYCLLFIIPPATFGMPLLIMCYLCIYIVQKIKIT